MLANYSSTRACDAGPDGSYLDARSRLPDAPKRSWQLDPLRRVPRCRSSRAFPSLSQIPNVMGGTSEWRQGVIYMRKICAPASSSLRLPYLHARASRRRAGESASRPLLDTQAHCRGSNARSFSLARVPESCSDYEGSSRSCVPRLLDISPSYEVPTSSSSPCAHRAAVEDSLEASQALAANAR